MIIFHRNHGVGMPYQITYASVKIEVLLTNACVIHLYVLCMDIQRGATGGL